MEQGPEKAKVKKKKTARIGKQASISCVSDAKLGSNHGVSDMASEAATYKPLCFHHYNCWLFSQTELKIDLTGHGPSDTGINNLTSDQLSIALIVCNRFNFNMSEHDVKVVD